MYSWDINDEEEEENNDVIYSGVHLVVFLIDATKKMKESMVGEDGLNSIQTSLKCAHATIKNKIRNNPKDCVGILTYGNSPKRTNESEFESVRQVLPLSGKG